jgi:hypothetical protein
MKHALIASKTLMKSLAWHSDGPEYNRQRGGGVSPTETAKLALPSNRRPMETSNESSGTLTIRTYLGHFMNSFNEL